MPSIAPPLIAGGNIAPATFIRLSTTANQTALAASTGEKAFGIADESTMVAPTDGASTYHATAGYPVKYFMRGETCKLTIGSGGCTAGDWLKSDSSGGGVAATTDKDFVGAIALETASAAELAEVLIVGFYLSV